MLNFEDFEFQLIIERLHINKDIDEYSDRIYSIINNSTKDKFKFTDLPPKLNIKKLIINIKKMNDGLSGELNLNKSKKTKDGWIIYINLKNGFKLYTLKHELNHALRLTLIGKDKMIKNLNYIKSQNIFAFSKNNEMDQFFYLMYLANDEEINSKIMETNGFIKEVMLKWDVSSLSKNDFLYIIKSSDAYKQSEYMINFKCEDLFKNWDNNKLNKLFYILEENKYELDRIQSSRFSKLRILVKTFKDILINTTNFIDQDHKIYKPIKGKDFYKKWIPYQGNKLRKRLYSLYDHYCV